MSNTLQFAGLFGRVLIAAIFLLAGVGKLMDWDGTAQYMALHRMKAVPTFETLAVVTIVSVSPSLSVTTRRTSYTP